MFWLPGPRILRRGQFAGAFDQHSLLLPRHAQPRAFLYFVWRAPYAVKFGTPPLVLKHRPGGRARTGLRQLQQPKGETARTLALACVAQTLFSRVLTGPPARDTQTERLTVSHPEEKQRSRLSNDTGVRLER